MTYKVEGSYFSSLNSNPERQILIFFVSSQTLYYAHKINVFKSFSFK